MRERDIRRFIKQARVVKGKRVGQALQPESARKYRSNIENYYRWMESEGFDDWFDLRPSDIGDFLVGRENDGKSGADIEAHIRSLKRFYGWLRQDYPGETNPVTQHLETTSYATTQTLREKNGYETKGVTEEEYQALLDNVSKRHGERDTLILRFLGEMGLRRKEVSQLELDDIDDDIRRLDVPNVKSGARSLPIPRSMKRDIRRWLEGGQRDAYQYAVRSERLFVSQQARTLSGQSMNKIVKNTAERAGIQETYEDGAGNQQHKITAHQLRHYFGQSQFDKNKMSLKALSEYMGHSSVDITADIYGDMDQDQVFDMLDKQFE